MLKLNNGFYEMLVNTITRRMVFKDYSLVIQPISIILSLYSNYFSRRMALRSRILISDEELLKNG